MGESVLIPICDDDPRGWLWDNRDNLSPPPSWTKKLAMLHFIQTSSLSMDYVLHLSPAPSLVIAVDMRDSPDILQVKTHPCELCLLSTSDVLSCNTVPSLSASHNTKVQG